jgi:Holliday junction resolvase
METAERELAERVAEEKGQAVMDMAAASKPVDAKQLAAPGRRFRDENGRRDLSADGMAAIRSVAAGAALGELFRYEIAEPVSIARQRSAMLPIVGEQVDVEKVSVYDDRVMSKHPLAGVRLVNSTKLDLMQGPITVFDAGAYAGDARIEDLPAGSSRLLTYAVDLDVEVAPRFEPKPEELVSVKLVKGALVASRKQARRKVFEVKNSGDEPVKLLIEHPIEPGWKLVGPQKADETTRDRYRFAVAAEPGKPATVEIGEEMPVEQSYGIATLDDANEVPRPLTEPRLLDHRDIADMSVDLEEVLLEISHCSRDGARGQWSPTEMRGSLPKMEVVGTM